LGWANPKLSNAILRSLRVIPDSNSWLQNKSFRGSQFGQEARVVPGRKPGMTWVDDDVERGGEDEL